ncbi:MAG: hypothetical protein HYR86_08680, partial [Candidatus Rokubacteria bacterium]|nr:hypothetical protein [Candidatus Rokubacteria bacterium]
RLEPGGLTFTLADGAFGLGGARTPLDAPLRGRITVEGKDLEGLVAVAMGPEPRLGGGLKATFSLAGTAGRPVLTGEVALANVTVTETNPQCPEPRRRTLALPSVTLAAGWEDGRFTGRPLMASVAGGTVTATVIAQVDRRITVQLGDLAIRALPLERVLVDFLCHAQAVSGPLDLTGTAAFTAGDIPRTLSGAGQVKIGAGRIVGVQALRMLDAIASVAGAVGTLLGPGTPVSSSALAEFDSITGTYQARDGVLTSRDLVFNGRAVKATIAGQYNLASGALSFDVVAAVAGRNVRARVTGTAAAPSVSVVPASLLSPGDAGRIEKGLQDLLKRMR